MITKPQSILILEAPSRHRIFMLLSVAPEVMHITDVIRLTRLPSRVAAWEVNFRVDALQQLKTVLTHFSKTGLPFEFDLEQ